MIYTDRTSDLIGYKLLQISDIMPAKECLSELAAEIDKEAL